MLKQSWVVYNAARRRRARESGLCITCLKRRPDTQRSVCSACSDAATQRTMRRRSTLRQNASLNEILAAHERAGDIARDHHFYEGSAQHYQDALGVSGLNQYDYVRLSEKLADVLSLGNDPGAADQVYHQLANLYLTKDESGEKTVETLLQSARHLWIAFKTEATLPLYVQAIHLAKRSGNYTLLKRANIYMAKALSQLARYEESEQYLSSVNELTPEDSPATHMTYWMQKGMVAAAFGKEKIAVESMDQAVHASQDNSDLYLATSVWVNYAFAATLLGRTDSAKTCHERALLIARRNNIVWRIPQLCLNYAQLLMRMGQYALAWDYLLDALSYDAKAPILDEIFSSVGIPLALHMQDKKVLAKCARTHTIELAFQSAEPSRIGLVASAFAYLYVEQRRRHKARELLHQAVTAMHDVMDAWDLPIAIARHGAPADFLKARKLLETRIAYPNAGVAEAHLRLFDAFAAQRRGQDDEAHVQARDAVNRFDALQWSAYADLAQSLLPVEQRFSSVKPPLEIPFSDMHARFTDREREVAALVLKGMTSREIASELSISPHTVDSHVNSIMNRLGIHSRHQLAYVLNEPTPF